ncbi:hypothetical protein [Polyangium aurulentum]|uniref:hypothetical protein n=1 Tax=Polyangium aurulentum TaxID=2567896 RepID=UPI0010AE0B2E|nr:hypothetical protein [Polyangium aurulentum]UQA62117.1 hypothetical protein E8A73_017230 [Polyangium aurulentum]
MKLASNWRLLMVAIGLATAGCSGAEPADSTIDERTSREVSERLKNSIGNGPQSLVCGDGKCKNGEDCSTCSADCGTCGTCAHDLCIAGPALDAACDPMAAAICAVDPFCCEQYWDGLCVSEVASVAGGSCAGVCGDGKCDGNEDCKSCAADCGTCGKTCNHDECVAGDKLSAACSKCAEAVCAADAFCCTVAWDGLCVKEVDTYCKKGCEVEPPKCGDNICDTISGESCSTCAADCGACPTCGDGVCDPMTENCQSCAADCGSCGGTCDHDTCTTGGPLDPSCDKCTAAICAVDPFCCTSAWDGICVNQVQTVCGDSSCSGGKCGDAVCDANAGESCWSCPGDCGACGVCGDGKCDSMAGEDCWSCTADCGSCPAPTCGDGICDAATGEDCGTCALDCGACGGTCDHDQCTTGGPLAASCNKCVDLVCQTDMFCCTSAWDAVCVSEVGSLCGETCTVTCGDSVCDGSIGENCSSCAADCGACPAPACGDGVCDAAVGETCGTCGIDCGACGCDHGVCETGNPLDASCDPCADKICQMDAFCCSGFWDGICVSEVDTICGQTCPASP